MVTLPAGEAKRAEMPAQLAAVSRGLRGAALESAVDRLLADRAIAAMDALVAQKRRELGL
jgi:hypothetical protein